MRVLFTIAHYFDPEGVAVRQGVAQRYGSLRGDPRPRLAALASCLAALRQVFGERQCLIDIARRTTVPANAALGPSVDVVICTTRGHHLLDRLPLDPADFEHRATGADPWLLGFECRTVLRDRLGAYDYYAYLEDDLIARDPWFFRKLAWFNARFGDDALLQPNRYETAFRGPLRRVYLDGDLRPGATERFQDVSDRPSLEGSFLDRPVRFARPLNPHSGCYALNASQMRAWTEREDFLDRETRFVGPLESAATLGIMRAFRVYKPAPEHAAFLEIEHFGNAFLNLIHPGGPIEPGNSG